MEVIGGVRLIYKSLGVKGLNRLVQCHEIRLCYHGTILNLSIKLCSLKSLLMEGHSSGGGDVNEFLSVITAVFVRLMLRRYKAPERNVIEDF